MQPPRPASNQNRLHHLLWECSMGLTPIIEEAFAGSDLRLASAGLLDEIGATPGATISELGRRTMKTQQAISQTVAKLERAGLLERRLGGGRSIGLHLTPAGEAAREDGIEREAQMETRLKELLGPDVYAELLTALEHSSVRFRTLTHPGSDEADC